MPSDKYRHAIERSDRFYQILLLCYPRNFRREYGPLMVQLFRDQCREALNKEGNWGLQKLWIFNSADLGKSACYEHLAIIKQKLNMSNTTLWNPRRRRGIAAVFVTICFATILITWLQPRYFVGTTRITVEKDPAKSVNGDETSTFSSGFDPYFIQTEFEKIHSKTVLYRVIEELDLNTRWAKKVKASSPLSTSETYALLSKSLDIRPNRNTSLIEIRMFSEDKNEAAQIANKIAEIYQQMRLQQATVASLKGLDVLENKLKEQDQRVKETKAKANSLREELGIAEASEDGGQQRMKEAGRIQELRSQANNTQMAAMQAENKYNQLAKLDLQELRRILPTALPDPLLDELTSRLNQADVEVISMKSDYGNDHPNMVKAKKVLAKLEEQVKERISGTLEGLKFKAQNLRKEQEILENSWAELNRKEKSDSAKLSAYFQAKHDLEMERQMQQSIAMRLNQEKLDVNLTRLATVEVVDRAEPGLRPVRPNWVMNLAVGLLIGVLVSAGLALMIFLKGFLVRNTASSAV